MPFWASDEAVPTTPPTSTLRVDPGAILQLKAEIQAIHDEVEMHLQTSELAWGMRPLGADPVSHDTADALTENATAAFDATWGFVDQLKGVLTALEQAASTYSTTEEYSADMFKRTT